MVSTVGGQGEFGMAELMQLRRQMAAQQTSRNSNPDPYPHFIGLKRWPGRVRAFDEDGEDEPALPDCQPAGLPIGLAGEGAAQAGDAAQEVPIGGEVFGWLLK